MIGIIIGVIIMAFGVLVIAALMDAYRRRAD